MSINPLFFKYLRFWDFPMRSKYILWVPVVLAQTCYSLFTFLYPGAEFSRREAKHFDVSDFQFKRYKQNPSHSHIRPILSSNHL